MVLGACLVLVAPATAEAQLRVVVADGEVTPFGVLDLPHKPSIDDNGDIAFLANIDGGQTALVWRAGVLGVLAQTGAPTPCGGATIGGIGDGLGGLESVSLRGQLAVFDIYGGGQRRVASEGGTLRCLASTGDTTPAGTLGAFQRHPLTNEAGETLVDDSRLWFVPNAGTSFSQIAGTGATLPVPAMHTPGRAVYWALDDDGDATVVIETTYLGGTRHHAFHGSPGAMTLIEPLGIAADDQWSIFGADGLGVSRDGIVAYQASVMPPAGTEYSGVWVGAPGATAEAFRFPLDADGVTLTALYARPHVIAASHIVAEMRVMSNTGPRQAIVRWQQGAASVIATTGAPLPGHPSVMVQRFGGVGVDATGTIYMQVFTGSVDGGVYRSALDGPIEKILATGDTLTIAGVDETVDNTSFETSRGTGYGTAVGFDGHFVFHAGYQGGVKGALVTFGAVSGPPPDLVLTIRRQYVYAEDESSPAFSHLSLTVRNNGTNTAMLPVLLPAPLEHFTRCPQGTTTLEQGCLFEPLVPGESIDFVIEFSRDDMDFRVEVSSDGQVDANPADNVVSGHFEKYERDACSCRTGARPHSLAPFILVFAIVMRRRQRPRH